MSDTKGDGSSEGAPCFGPRPGTSPVSKRAPARADFEKWARRDRWRIAEGAMLILGFEPFEITTNRWPEPPAPGFADIYETALRSDEFTAQGHWVSPCHFLAWAREKAYRVPSKLEKAVNRVHPMAVAQTPSATQGATQERDEPIAKRKAPDKFIAAVIRLIAEISKRSAEKGVPFDVTEMPGTKKDLWELAIKFDAEFDKTLRTFDDYLAGLLQFKQGARETTFYQGLFPEFFASP